MRRQQSARHYDLELLNLVKQRECAMDRDRVYGILELISPEIRQAVTIDTTAPTRQVFTEFAGAFLRHHGA